MSKRKSLFRKRAPKTQKEAIREYCSDRRAGDKKRHQQAPLEKFTFEAKDRGQRTSPTNGVEDRSGQTGSPNMLNDRSGQAAPTTKKELPKKFPFWARFRMSKQRTTLVIDETPVINKKTNRTEDGYVHREATHTAKRDYEKIEPNPDKDDPEPMYLKRPRKHPKKLFEPHNKALDMPEHLRKRYDKNNNKSDK